MVADGAATATVAFGPGDTPVPVERLLKAGESRFSDQAASDRVGLLMTNDQATVEVLLGCLAVGSRLVSLPLPGRGIDLSEYASFLKNVCAAHQLDELVVADGYAALLEGVGLQVRRHSELGGRPLASPSREGFALVQFTSGSTGNPRPVEVDDAKLGANVAAILETLGPRPGDCLVSWLPLSHDMGLVGMLLTGMAAASTGRMHAPIVLLEPETFLRSPNIWVEALSRFGGSFTAAPDFGYRLATRRRPAGDLDLSPLRCAIVGGEVVRGATLEAFVETFADAGLRSEAVCPAYGMAEVGLAVSITSPEEVWRDRRVSAAAVAGGLVRTPRDEADEVRLVASGRTLPGYEVSCPDAARGVGSIAIRGPSIGADPFTGHPLADADGFYRPGDVGFVDEGWVYVCGREDDTIVANGCNIYGPAVEAAVGGVDGVRPGRVTAVGLPTGEWAVVAEPSGDQPLEKAQFEALARAIRHAAVQVGAAKPDRVVILRRGQLPLTASGKIQRTLVRSKLVDGELD